MHKKKNPTQKISVEFTSGGQATDAGDIGGVLILFSIWALFLFDLYA